ncbi:MAG: hypothetical protein ISS58_03860 [Dehalococcoidales bacterium]|nr:hypothetical protein [Dehalococcoidales bacterium]
MAAIMMTAGGLLIPLGFYLLVEKFAGYELYAKIAIILGVVCWGVAVRIVQKEEKKTEAQNKEILSLLTSIEQKMGSKGDVNASL